MTEALRISNSLDAPVEVDRAAEDFNKLKLDLAEAKKKLEAALKLVVDRENELIELVRTLGGPHATKSKILHGIAWEMVATFAQYTSIDHAAVERFRMQLLKARKAGLLKKLFSRDIRYTLLPGAAQIAQAEKLAPKLMLMLLLCSTTGNKKPSLDVRPKKKPAMSA